MVLWSCPDNKVFRSENDGKDWEEISSSFDNEDLSPVYFLSSPANPNEIAFAVANSGSTLYITKDKGRSWLKQTLGTLRSNEFILLILNTANPDYIALQQVRYEDNDDEIEIEIYHSNDGLKSIHQHHEMAGYKFDSCIFANTKKKFEGIKDSRLFCLKTKDGKGILYSTDDWFSSINRIMEVDGDWFYLQAVESFIILTTTNRRVKNRQFSHFESLYVTNDAKVWNKANFPANSNRKNTKFRVLSSAENSLHVQEYSFFDGFPNSQGGIIYTSDSTGSKFIVKLRDVSPFNSDGMDKVERTEGVWLMNFVNTSTDVQNVESRLSLDDAKTWSRLAIIDDPLCKIDSGCTLLVDTFADDSMTSGDTDTSPAIMMAIGRPSSNSLQQGTYVSRNSGLNWKLALDDEYYIVYGDQGNIIVAYSFSKDFKYSIDRGSSWKKLELDSTSIVYSTVLTNPDSTSLKFIVLGEDSISHKNVSFAIDFENMYERQCSEEKGDFEDWYARYDANGEATCVLGHKEKYRIKKLDINCYVGTINKEPIPEEISCPCTIDDFECDFGFEYNQDTKECLPEPLYAKDMFKKYCEGKNNEFEFTANMGYRKIASSKCDTSSSSSVAFDKEKKYKCGDEVFHHSEQNIISHSTVIPGGIVQYYYLDYENSNTLEETIVAVTSQFQIYVSHDGGNTFEKPFKDEQFSGVFLNPYFSDDVYFIRQYKKLFYSSDRIHTVKEIRNPDVRGLVSQEIHFNKVERNWIIWINSEGCDSSFSECKQDAYYSLNHGSTWTLLQENIRKCDWVSSKLGHVYKPTNIFCEKVIPGVKNEYKLITTDDYFEHTKTEFKKIIGFVINSNFIVVAKLADNGEHLEAHVSIDSETFAQAKFPYNFNINAQQAYTVLNSITDSIFFHVTTHAKKDGEFGTIFKSNSNGTSFVTSIENVNRNKNGFVDFERMQIIDGIIIVNIVSNTEEVKTKGVLKQLKTMITYNDGSKWQPIKAPKVDSLGNAIDCHGNCALHLHGFTERDDIRDTFSSASAIGLMFASGNVGESLSPKRDGNTYLTTDGGISWKEVKKGVYMWEYGDQGSVIVLVNGQDNTNVIYYSMDEGLNWKEYQFSESKVHIDDIGTVPSDTSRKFTLYGRTEMKQGDQSIIFQIDFSDFTNIKCLFDSDRPEEDDFYIWTPTHPNQKDNCLFGGESKYPRKKVDRFCYVGAVYLKEYEEVIPCECTREDYECDYNYFRGVDDVCRLVEGYSPKNASEVCGNANVANYWELTGYRKISMSSCKGGQEFDKSEKKTCPERGRRLSGSSIFFIVISSIGGAALITSCLYYFVINKNGRFVHFGQIRLGEEEFDDGESAFVKYPILVISAILAAGKVAPHAFKVGFEYIKTAISGRRQQHYDPLLGDMSDEDE